MKLKALLEDRAKLFRVQQLLIDALGDEWDVGFQQNKITLSNHRFPGPVWFGPVDYADLPNPIDTKAEIEQRVIENYEAIQNYNGEFDSIDVISARCANDHTCTASICVKDITDAFRAICAYNGWRLADLMFEETIGDLVAHLNSDVKPA